MGAWRFVGGYYNNVDINNKNPAYGRHQISRPMLIEAPIQKKTYKDFSPSSGDLVKRGWDAVHSTAENRPKFYPLNYTALFPNALHFTEN